MTQITEAIDQLKNLEATMREFELEHEGLFNQRKEIAGAIEDKTAEVKAIAKELLVEDLRYNGIHIKGTQSVNRDYDGALLMALAPVLAEKGIVKMKTSYAVDEKKLAKAVEAGIIEESLVESAKRFTPRSFAVRVEHEEAL